MPSDEQVVVSGLPRSGTSMMMRMLEAGGMPVHHDATRSADIHNPHGYYELEAVKRLPQEPELLGRYPGGAIKVIYALLYWLPLNYSASVVFMRRSLQEIADSQHRMLSRKGSLADDGVSPALLANELEEFSRWLRSRPALRVLEVHYDEVLRDPLGESTRISGVLDCDLDPSRMARAVDPTLWRERGQ